MYRKCTYPVCSVNFLQCEHTDISAQPKKEN